jgi:predicted ribosomally synthesized peptide with nif11-like leader
MSVESCTTFLQEIVSSNEIEQQMKAMTDPKEVIAMGKRYGYTFDARDLATASIAFKRPGRSFGSSAQAKPAPALNSAFYHYEFDMRQIPGFEPIIREMSNLKIQPVSVNMDLYKQSFREDDFQFTSMSPADPDFAKRYEEIMHPYWQHSSVEHDFSRRDFHLINLDQHVDHSLYSQYFQAKARTISFLEGFFDSEIRFSGSLWYPPMSYRLWHTNETQAGWRMYLVDLDEPTSSSRETSFFRYMNPMTKEIVTLAERPQLVRFFKIEQEKDKLFWHCIVNPTMRNRWSFGFAIPDNWLDKFPRQ